MTELPFCECGECGLRVTKKGNRFISGHNNRGKIRLPSHCEAISKAKKGIPKSPSHCKIMSDSAIRQHAKKKYPLPQGQKIHIPENSSSAVYLGCIAEELLARTFKNVKRMPYGNKGYDIICNQNFKIDVKSSATGDKGYWYFTISKNTIADYFLCIAFESRNNLNPVHLWLIPGKDVNRQVGFRISKRNLHKWSKYEQPLDTIIACCNKMRN